MNTYKLRTSGRVVYAPTLHDAAIVTVVTLIASGRVAGRKGQG